MLRDAIAVWFCPVGCWNAGGVEEVFCAPGNAVKRAAIFAGGYFTIGLARLFESVIFGQRDYAAQFRIEALKAIQIDAGESLGGDLARLDPAGKLLDGSGVWGAALRVK